MNNPKYFHKPVLEKFKTQGVRMHFFPSLCGYWIFDWLKRYKIEQSAVTDDAASAIAHVGGLHPLESSFLLCFQRQMMTKDTISINYPYQIVLFKKPWLID